ncbi:PaaI family thioesterase [Thalassospira alkalitolerans]|uniref:Thioesterase n=1 Tax=Thalassospira alkalitolerans TaxID=1293890 RepID=A0A1Y2LC57_9PROT|nr:PaaI family thioesterase [Thalassospira alkalitolerans]OSQ48359.1 thioesterase [Thalassospira alkalitolerans]
MTVQQPRTGVTLADFDTIMREKVPFVGDMGVVTEQLSADQARLRLPFNQRHIRPGNVICGPAIFALADIALYAVAWLVVPKADLAVTTEATVHFLSGAKPGDLLADAKILKAGKRLLIAECHIRSAVDGALCAHVIGTYAMPPEPR